MRQRIPPTLSERHDEAIRKLGVRTYIEGVDEALASYVNEEVEVELVYERIVSAQNNVGLSLKEIWRDDSSVTREYKPELLRISNYLYDDLSGLRMIYGTLMDMPESKSAS